MKAFRFRPDGLLQLRRQEQRAAEASFAQVQQAADHAAAEVDRATRAVQTGIAAYHAALHTSRDAAIFERHRTWIVGLRLDVERTQALLEECGRALSAAAERVRLAHQRVRVLERLRQRASRSYEAAARQQEMKDIDQIATLQYARRLLSGGTDSDH